MLSGRNDFLIQLSGISGGFGVLILNSSASLNVRVRSLSVS